MSSVAARFGEISGAVAAGCDRLVHPRVTDRIERARQARLLGVLLAGPFLTGAAAWLLVPASIGLQATILMIGLAFATAWLAALALSATSRIMPAAAVTLMLATVQIAVLLAASGGTASPVGLIALCLPIEAWRIFQTRRALLWGTVAAVGASTAQGVIAAALFSETGAGAWQWLLPIAYATTLLPRLNELFGRGEMPEAADRSAELEAALDAVIVRMALNGDVTDVGDKASVTLGLRPEFMMGSGFLDRIHVGDRVAYLHAIADLRQGAPRRKAEIRVRLPQVDSRATDTYRPFLIEMALTSGASPSIVGFLRGNDELAGVRAELAAAVESIDRADLAKGRFLAAVSHELRTPLNSIIGFSDMLLHEMFGGFKDARQKEYVTLVRDSGHHLLAVVNAILDVSKIEAGSYDTNPEPFVFREAVDMCRSMMMVQAQAKRIAVSVQCPVAIGDVRADKRAIQQILLNLVSNAVKFTPECGSVTIGAKRIGSRLHFWVADTGIGIAEQDLALLGKPFTQVQNDYTRQFEGTGLGLSLVKGLVGLHEGTMTIDSAVGEGTTVTITLPVDGPAGLPVRSGADVVTIKPVIMSGDAHGTLRKAG